MVVHTKFRSAREPGDRRTVSAAEPSALGCPFELIRDLRIRSDRGRCTVPRSLVVVDPVEGLGQGMVRRSPLLGRSHLVQRRTEQRVAHLHGSSVDGDESLPLGSSERICTETQSVGGAQYGIEPTFLGGGNDQEQLLCREREPVDTVQVQPLHRAGERELLRERLIARELSRRQGGRQFDEREGIAAALLDDGVPDVIGDLSAGLPHEQGGRDTSRAADDGRSSSRSRNDGRSRASNRDPSGSRVENNITTPSASRRRATKNSASTDGVSSAWASSMRHSSSPCWATSETRVKHATEIRNRSSPERCASPKAPRRATA